MTPSRIHRGSRFETIALWAGVIVIGGAIVVLADRWAQFGVMRWLMPWMDLMSPAAAFCFILAGASLILQTLRPGAFVVRIARVLAFLVLTVACLKLVGSTMGWDFLTNGWIFPDQLILDGVVSANRIAPNTVLSFLLVGTALLLPEWTTRLEIRLAEILSLITGLISLLALLGYFHEESWLGGMASQNPMAFLTAVTFLVLAVGIVCARPHCGLMAVVLGDSSGGLLARRMFPAMVLVFFLVGALRLVGEHHGYYEAELGMALYTIATIGIFGIYVLWYARSMHQLDAERRRGEASILKLNAELLEQSARLEQVNRELESFSYSVSHDLRAPLRGISGFAMALEDHAADSLDPTSLGYLKRVRDAAGRMGELIDDLLKLARTTGAEMTVKPVNLSELATSLVAELRQMDPGREVEVVIAPGLRVLGDRALLRVLLDNLIANAWKFSARNPQARIEVGGCLEAEGRLRCFVRDNGAGFDRRNTDKLFRAFQRFHAQSEFPGTGIGLATVHRIMLRHGGEVRASGETGRGATFEFTLEAAPQPEKP